ncbi:MFS general substrate transporter [Bimuria novae-zelandiae CBS 107.79]|uniref:MFS general substrate transporter n=1 Tax=Bimuria novae-zelandiae CBS 107.79 TaxID=1447943 RepID=A0A6A5UUL6_9PLEO|nr:MFS general substrate transporter [Bimuria novae-zelandiae CBS 107.79]
MFIINPFKNHDISDFPDTHVNLADAEHRNSIVSARRQSLTQAPSEKDKNDSSSGKDSDAHSGHGGASIRAGSTRGLTLAELRDEIDHDISANDTQSIYDRKSKIINRAIADMGMGRYQWQLFVLCGFGWMADNLWLQGVALTLPSLSSEFGVSETEVRYTTLSLFLGLCIGASFWGVASDVVGRRLAFNFTLMFAGIFGLAAGGGPNWIGVCALYACLGLGVGGNLPVDGALFLEFLPGANNNLLTLLSAFWSFGQLIASLLAWALIPNFSCPADAATCTKDQNWGWRYLVLTLGAITFTMFLCRFLLFHLFESPKYLLSQGRQREAVAVVHGIAYHNKTKTWLSEDILDQVGGKSEEIVSTKMGTIDIVKNNLGKFSGERMAPLFKNKKMGFTMVLLWFQWTTIGMGYPLFNAFLPQYLANSGSAQPTSTSITYRNYAITSVCGCPGSILAYFLVNVPFCGRKKTMIVGTALTGVFVFLFTLSGDPDFQLAFSCLEACFQQIMYGVLYAYTPEVIPAPNRGTGTGISSFLNRLAGLCAPIVAVNAGSSNPKAPIYASGGLILAAFVSMFFLPIETQGASVL